MQFTATGTINNGTALTYAWTFGDGGTSTNQNPLHTYNNLPGGTYVAQVTGSDGLGDTNVAPVTVTVNDSTPPAITCPANVTVNANAGVCYATGVVLGTPTASDNSGSVTVTSNAPAQFNKGVTTVTWTATDPSGNTATCTQTVTVNDTQPPMISPPANVTVNANAGVCYATGVVLGTPAASDNCGSVTVTSNAPAQFNKGVTTVTWTATDSSGYTAACTQTVTVNDTQPPTISCPADVTVVANAGCTATGVALGSPSTSDNCSVASVVSNSPAVYPLGTNVVTWTVTDGSGNTATCTQRVIVRDTSAPTISCPADVTVSANAGCTATNVALVSPTTSDNCSVALVTNSAPAVYPLGTNVVTWTVTDGSGNTATCTQRVIVWDTTAPTISCPADVTVAANAGCTATNVALGSPVTGDNCSVVSVVSNAPAVYPLGTNVVTWTVTDGSGNTATCTQRVIVRDTSAPTISCPADVTVAANAGCTATNVALGSPVTGDNCSVVSVVSNAPAVYPLGTNVVTWTVTDGSGNTATCTQRVIVRDTSAPTISCPADVTVAANAGCTATNVTLGSATTGDNCSVASVVSNAPAVYPLGTNVVTWTVTDGSGNTATCTQRVIVRDTTAPTISCPADVTVSANAGCTATGVVLGSPTTSDNCSVASVTNSAPAVYPLGTNVVTWTVTDGSGNTATCTQRVIVRDTTAPTISCPADVTVSANAGCTATGVVLGSPSTSDNCSVASVTNSAPAAYPLGTNVVTWTVTDGSGNTAACTQRVIVLDTTAPTITCPADVTVSANAGCTATGVALGTPVTGDNCNVKLIGNNARTSYPLGTNVVTWTVTDGSGNKATCTQRVIVRDTQPPTISCPADVTVSANAGCTATGVPLGSPITSDNCSVASVVSNAPAVYPLGTNVVTWTVTDGSGNAATCTQRVIVRDTTAPTITCPANVMVSANAAGCTATNVVFGQPGDGR